MSEAGQAIAVVAEDVSPKPRFRAWWFGLLTVAVAVLYYDTLARLVRNWWEDPNFSHGFLVPAFAVFVAWQHRSELVKIPHRPKSWGLAVSIGSALILIAGTLGARHCLASGPFIVLLAGLPI